MHGDGGAATGPLFFGPEILPRARVHLSGCCGHGPGRHLLMASCPLNSTCRHAQRRAILGRSIGIALKAGGRLQIALATNGGPKGQGLRSIRDLCGRRLRSSVGRGLFDPKYMNALYDYGLAQGRSDARFRKGPPAPGPVSPTCGRRTRQRNRCPNNGPAPRVVRRGAAFA